MDAANKGIKLALLSVGEVESFFSVVQLNKTGVTVLSHVGLMDCGSIDMDMILAGLIEKLALEKCKQITLDELKSKKT